MLLRSPKSLHYPITVTQLLKQPDDAIERFAPLFSYFYKSVVTEGNKYGEEFQVEKTFPTRFESEADGTLVSWNIAVGDVIEGPGVLLAEIEEPCRHEIQFAGLCANCGKDMTEVNYAQSIRNTERAKINMAHENTALTISEEEATRVEDEAKRRLLSTKKLSLVVDLDQTIIHATVDPTVAEWMQDETNPNHNAVKDVAAFQLTDDGPGAKGCWYYIKLRPGLRDFLRNISKLYELHIYTMGTRAYAQNIAKIVDPDRKIFGDRILSRDESGSLTTKTLHRLFPVDTKMVVIIDDRGDVWSWSSNLIKVTPYDFFVGIGDINSSFLPKRQELVSSNPPEPQQLEGPPSITDAPEPAEVAAAQTEVADASPKSSANFIADADASVTDLENTKTPLGEAPPKPNGNISSLGNKLVAMGNGDDSQLLEKQMNMQGELIAAQMEDRPLLRMQQKLDQEDEEAGKEQAPETGADLLQEHKHRHVLHDNDTELIQLEDNLRAVHRAFFEEYERRLVGSAGGRVAQLKGSRITKKKPLDDLDIVPDIKDIMPKMKRAVLSGVSIVFSGIIPLGINVHSSDIALWAMSFGAHVSTKITKRTTHVIANKERKTAKVKQAARYSHIKIVTVSWLLESISNWKRVGEEPHMIHVDTETPGGDFSYEIMDEPLLSGDEHDLELTGDEDDGATLDTEDDISNTQSLGELPEEEELYDKEMLEFLGYDPREDTSDDDDISADESGAESVTSNASIRSTDSASNAKKRKRETESTNASEAEESDSSTESAHSAGVRRRKKPFQRVSSLNNMITADQSSGLPSPETTGPEEDHAEGNDKGGAEGDDGFGDLEAEMLAEFEKDDGNEVTSTT